MYVAADGNADAFVDADVADATYNDANEGPDEHADAAADEGGHEEQDEGARQRPIHMQRGAQL